MGTKSKDRDFQEWQEIRWYQWEFLRRNSDYRKDYDSLMVKFGPWFQKRGFWYQVQRGEVRYSPHDSSFYYNNICPAIRIICAEWCISDPYPPEWAFDEHGFRKYAGRRLVSLPTGYTSEAASLLWDLGQVEPVRGNGRGVFSERFRLREDAGKKRTEQHTPPDSRLLLLTIDVSRPQRELVPLVLSAIKRQREKLSRETSSFDDKQPRRRLDQYSAYLRVWDLRNSGRTFPEIAKEIYPKEYPGHPAPRNPINQRVQDHFRRAVALIQGGYKELA